METSYIENLRKMFFDKPYTQLICQINCFFMFSVVDIVGAHVTDNIVIRGAIKACKRLQGDER